MHEFRFNLVLNKEPNKLRPVESHVVIEIHVSDKICIFSSDRHREA
jgi:hypothetical protein